MIRKSTILLLILLLLLPFLWHFESGLMGFCIWLFFTRLQTFIIWNFPLWFDKIFLFLFSLCWRFLRLYYSFLWGLWFHILFLLFRTYTCWFCNFLLSWNLRFGRFYLLYLRYSLVEFFTRFISAPLCFLPGLLIPPLLLLKPLFAFVNSFSYTFLLRIRFFPGSFWLLFSLLCNLFFSLFKIPFRSNKRLFMLLSIKVRLNHWLIVILLRLLLNIS